VSDINIKRLLDFNTNLKNCNPYPLILYSTNISQPVCCWALFYDAIVEQSRRAPFTEIFALKALNIVSVSLSLIAMLQDQSALAYLRKIACQVNDKAFFAINFMIRRN
jgi:hypothetical protein